MESNQGPVDQLDASPPVERYEAKDAFWLVRSIDYVAPGPPPTASLFDDEARLERAWQLTRETLGQDARASDSEKKRRIELVKEVAAGAERRARERIAEESKSPETAENPTEHAVSVNFAGRLVATLGRWASAALTFKTERGVL